MNLVHLFLVFLRVGLFAIGGAYSFLPILEKEIVQKYHWLSRGEFLDIQGLTEMLPGAISVKFASYTGYKIAGVAGAAVANLGILLVPAVSIISVSLLYARYNNLTEVKAGFNMIRLALFAMIIAVAFKLVNVNQLIHLRSLFIVILSFVLFLYTKIHPAWIIISAGILGVVWK